MRQLTPDVPMDADVLMEVDLAAYTAALERSVFWSCQNPR
jgi:hypothetical protein